MKKIFTLITILIGLNSYAQQEDLMEQVWILSELNISNSEITIPVDSEIEEVILYFDTNQNLTTEVCDYLQSGFGFAIDETSLYIPELYQSFGDCNSTENNIFQGNYFSFFTQSSNALFSYEIVNNGNISTLTITAENGDYAIYNSQVLSTETILKDQFSIYPNPTTERFQIDKLHNQLIREINVFSIDGKLVKNFRQHKSFYDISQLSNGIYFLSININGKNIVKKIIKN
ncbi:T9SS type A sorting domain-containing protein [Mesonia sp.]|uniref:T9SS type A sorting domain-containing protein n=1 Tax=Mesonia sp. TaxID=1960830 RepID=UPI0017585D88|nr:T9SS type A sorting domain-containing protein [Mesonia sp.]HIB38237.1 T9SS type A sorting domain-containing protein [Mesonia sp.]HIO26540.1 T9SS type A sorting domain-containing protein [Flavobacteriaceae bacterium]